MGWGLNLAGERDVKLKGLWCRPNVSRDALDGTKYQGLLAWARCLSGHFGQEQMSGKGSEHGDSPRNSMEVASEGAWPLSDREWGKRVRLESVRKLDGGGDPYVHGNWEQADVWGLGGRGFVSLCISVQPGPDFFSAFDQRSPRVSQG